MKLRCYIFQLDFSPEMIGRGADMKRNNSWLYFYVSSHEVFSRSASRRDRFSDTPREELRLLILYTLIFVPLLPPNVHPRGDFDVTFIFKLIPMSLQAHTSNSMCLRWNSRFSQKFASIPRTNTYVFRHLRGSSLFERAESSKNFSNRSGTHIYEHRFGELCSHCFHDSRTTMKDLTPPPPPRALDTNSFEQWIMYSRAVFTHC